MAGVTAPPGGAPVACVGVAGAPGPAAAGVEAGPAPLGAPAPAGGGAAAVLERTMPGPCVGMEVRPHASWDGR